MAHRRIELSLKGDHWSGGGWSLGNEDAGAWLCVKEAFEFFDVSVDAERVDLILSSKPHATRYEVWPSTRFDPPSKQRNGRERCITVRLANGTAEAVWVATNLRARVIEFCNLHNACYLGLTEVCASE